MEPVVTINLAGNPYQLDQSAYDVLRAYLDRANTVLASNPDQAEIIRDLEQAVADKCASYLSAHKSVVSNDEMRRILEEMGPVESDDGTEAPGGATASGEAPPKKLYRMPEGAWIAGVCNGIAAYLSVDVTWVRIAFVVMGLITHGWLLLAYVIAMFVIPTAHTSAEWAAAHGIPSNAEEVINMAKSNYAAFTRDGPPWRWSHDSRRAWKRAMRERARAWRQWAPAPPPGPPVGYATRMFAGFFAFLFSIVSAALLIAFLLALFSLLGSGAILGWTPPADIPIWLGIVVLAILYAALSAPFRALRNSSFATMNGWRSHNYAGGDGLLGVAFIAIAGWWAYTYVPEAHDWMDNARVVIEHFFRRLFG